MNTKHTIKLPHGFRIDAVTRRFPKKGEIHVDAEIFEGSESRGDHSVIFTSDEVRTCGDLIRLRNEFFAILEAQEIPLLK